VIKFLKRVLIFFTVSFVSLNVVIFFVLNSQTVQHAIVEYININYFNKQKLELGLGSLSLNLFNGSLNLNEVSIKEKDKKSEVGKVFFLSLNQLTVSFDIISSYIKRSPVLRKIILRGGVLSIPYDSSGHLVLPEFLNSNNKIEDIKPLDIPFLLNENINKISFEIEAINLVLNLGTENQTNYQKISISHLEVKKDKSQKGIPAIKTNLLITDSSILFPWQTQKMSISLINIEVLVASDGSFLVHNLELKSNLANLVADVRGVISSNIKKSSYIANIKYLDVSAKDVFNLLEMKSSGRAIISGTVVSGKLITDDPIFNGRAKWHDFTLKQFDIYSGEAELYFKDRTIHYSNAVITTPKNGLIHANGKFQLFDKFYFENSADIQSFSFAELLHGLGVPFTPVDFTISSKNMLVSGHIMSQNQDKAFELFAKGLGRASQLIVTSFQDQKGREPIPDLDFNLDLSASILGLSITNTKIYATKNKIADMGSLQIKKGYIDFTPKEGIAVDVKLNGSNVNLSSLSYFLKFPTSGIGDMNGGLTVKAGSTDVIFNAEAHVKDGEIFGIKFNDFIGKLGLTPKYVWAKDSVIGLSNKDKTKFSTIYLKELNVVYSDLKSKIIAYSDVGESDVFSYSISHWLSPQFVNTSGKIQKLSVDMDGLLLHPSTWNLKANSRINDLEILNGKIKDTNIDLNCIAGICSKSILSFTDITSKDEVLPDSNAVSFALFELLRFSFEDATFRGKISKLPLGLFSNSSGNKISGYLNSNVQLSGKWKSLEGFADIHGFNVKYNEIDIGDFSLNVSPTDQKQIKFDLKSFSNQVSISYFTPQNFEGMSYLNIDLLDFDATSLLSDEVRSQNNLFSQISAKVRLSGQSPFTPNIQNNWYRLWSASGVVESGSIQFGRMIFDLSTNNQLSFNGNEFTMSALSFNGQLGKIEIGKSFIDFSKMTVSTSLSIDANLSKIDQVSDFFGPSDGSILGKFTMEGSWKEPKTSGYLSVDANTLSLRNYQPAFTNLNGRLVFNGNKLELQGFNAQKGDGPINGAGSIDFSTIFKETPEPPEMFFKFSARNSDLRLQIPIFQVADTNFDADISFSGNGRPYLISGDINLKKLRVFKDIDCNEIANQIISQNIGNNQQITPVTPFAELEIKFQAVSSIVIQSQCVRGRFSTNPNLMVTGDTTNPILVGKISTDTANLFLLKSRFEVKKAEFDFIELQKYDPNVDIQMESRVSSYIISANINGKFSRARLDLSISPSLLPNGDRATQADIISIISTGQIPAQSSSANLLSASTGVFSFFGGGGVADLGFLNNTLSTVTGGLVDNVNVVPTSQNGQLSWRATVSRSLSERLNLGVSYQGASGDVGASQAAYATFLLNDTISLFSSFSSSTPTASQIQTTNEFTGGLRFRFGGQ
jgi:translocation and assembly module TamB